MHRSPGFSFNVYSSTRLFKPHLATPYVSPLTENGEVLTAGANHCGQLGQVQAGHDCHTFKLVEGLKSKQVRSISAGGEFTCTLVAREWVGDDEAVACMKCGGKFTFSNRRVGHFSRVVFVCFPIFHALCSLLCAILC